MNKKILEIVFEQDIFLNIGKQIKERLEIKYKIALLPTSSKYEAMEYLVNSELNNLTLQNENISLNKKKES